MTFTLTELGFAPFFANQSTPDTGLTPFRISEIHRDRLSALSVDGLHSLTSGPDQSTGEFAVGDWVLAGDDGRIETRLERKTLLHRRAAGEDKRVQLIAANVDVVFITSSCNPDFNPARLERYLALAFEAGCFAVIVLTKADKCDDPAVYVSQAQDLDRNTPVLAVNALDKADIARVAGWCKPGQTAVLIGSSGVGKTTLTNGLCNRDDDTGAIREDDGRGRHVTTKRALRHMENGGWIIDTPGMRALRLEQVSDGIETLFADINALADTCRFRDCSHEAEPGCEVKAAVASGALTPDRVARWNKLRREDLRNSETIAQTRSRSRSFGKKVHAAKKRGDWPKVR